MKKYKSIIAVLLAVVLLCTLIACKQKPKTETVTRAVTNANGEVVTDKNGDPVTEEIEAVVVTDANGQPVTEIITGSDGKAVTKVVNGEYVNVTQAVTESVNVGNNSNGNKNSGGNNANNNSNSKSGSGNTTTTVPGKKDNNKNNTTKKGETTKKGATTKKGGNTKAGTTIIKKPTAPSVPKKAWTDKVKKDSLVLYWSPVKCNGYEVQYSDNGETFKSLKKSTTATELEVKGLVSNTKYTFRIRAYNKNKGGRSVSKWVKTTATTLPNNDKRYITFHITLPVKANEEDTLILSVKEENSGDVDVYSQKVKLDGSTIKINTEKWDKEKYQRRYKGKVIISAKLKKTGSSFKGDTDKEVYSFSLSGDTIHIIDGEDD
ncbi:MAG: fibronectin type III domain-containing protein [Eubacterium sp.]|nr:fibronectin type III domain-containing protein [Eubacterium sp.]